MKHRLLLGVITLCGSLSGCFSAKIVEPASASCQLLSKQYTLEVTEEDPLEQSLKAINACIDPACMLYTPILTGVIVPAGSLVVSGSLVVVGNTLHWLEMQGRCDDSQSQQALSQLRESTQNLGGMVLHSVDDVRAWLSALSP
jgi:hypothetical protein